MSVRLAFVDSNVVVSGFEATAPAKPLRAREPLRDTSGCCGWPVIQSSTTASSRASGS
jgi:hypothetical protein